MLAVGSELTLAIVRDGREREVQLQIEEDLDARLSGQRLDSRLEGLRLIRIPERSSASGVLIEDVRRNSRAWRAGLRAGDIVVAANGQRVQNLAELRRLFPGDETSELALEIRRRGVAYLVPME